MHTPERAARGRDDGGSPGLCACDSLRALKLKEIRCHVNERIAPKLIRPNNISNALHLIFPFDSGFRGSKICFHGSFRSALGGAT
jgi:hypothetical protein